MWQRKRKEAEEFVVIYPWVAWSEDDTEKTRRMVRNIFDKDPSHCDGGELSTILEMFQDIHEEKGMVMIIPEAIAEGLMASEGISMDPTAKDMWGRKRYPEILRGIGFSQQVLDELNISFKNF